MTGKMISGMVLFDNGQAYAAFVMTYKAVVWMEQLVSREERKWASVWMEQPVSREKSEWVSVWMEQPFAAEESK